MVASASQARKFVDHPVGAALHPDDAPDAGGISQAQLTELAGLLQRLSQIEKHGRLDSNALKALHAELARRTDAPSSTAHGGAALGDLVRSLGDMIGEPPVIAPETKFTPPEYSGIEDEAPADEPAEDGPPPFAGWTAEPTAPLESDTDVVPSEADEITDGGTIAASEEHPPETRGDPPKATASYLTAARLSAIQAQQPPPEGTFLAHSMEEWLPSGRLRRPGTIFAVGAAGLALLVGAFLVLSWQAAPHVPAVAPNSPEQAVPQWDRIAASAHQGNAHAQAMLGAHELGQAHDPAALSQAIHWLQRAADRGEPDAQFRLGTLYATGRGVTRNDTKAAQLYALAAGNGNRNAMYNLAVAFVQGDGIPQNPEQAARWFQKAAQLGVVNAQFDLAVLYERGLGAPRSLTDAYHWYSIAALAGDAQAAERVKALASQLSPDEREAAAAAAKQFKAAAEIGGTAAPH